MGNISKEVRNQYLERKRPKKGEVLTNPFTTVSEGSLILKEALLRDNGADVFVRQLLRVTGGDCDSSGGMNFLVTLACTVPAVEGVPSVLLGEGATGMQMLAVGS